MVRQLGQLPQNVGCFPLQCWKMVFVGLDLAKQDVEGGDVAADAVHPQFVRLHQRRPRPAERIEHRLANHQELAKKHLRQLRDVLAQIGVKAVNVFGPLSFGKLLFRPVQGNVLERRGGAHVRGARGWLAVGVEAGVPFLQREFLGRLTEQRHAVARRTQAVGLRGRERSGRGSWTLHGTLLPAICSAAALRWRRTFLRRNPITAATRFAGRVLPDSLLGLRRLRDEGDLHSADPNGLLHAGNAGQFSPGPGDVALG